MVKFYPACQVGFSRSGSRWRALIFYWGNFIYPVVGEFLLRNICGSDAKIYPKSPYFGSSYWNKEPPYPCGNCGLFFLWGLFLFYRYPAFLAWRSPAKRVQQTHLYHSHGAIFHQYEGCVNGLYFYFHAHDPLSHMVLYSARSQG